MPSRPESSALNAIWRPWPSAPMPAFGGHERVVVVRGGGRDRVQAHLLLGLAEGQALGVAWDQEARDPARAFAGAGEQVVEVGDAAVGDPRLRPVDSVPAVGGASPCTPARRRPSRPAAPTGCRRRSCCRPASPAATCASARRCRTRRGGGRRGCGRSPRPRPRPSAPRSPRAPAGTPRRAGRRRPTPRGRAGSAGPPRRVSRRRRRGRSRPSRGRRRSGRGPCRRCCG